MIEFQIAKEIAADLRLRNTAKILFRRIKNAVNERDEVVLNFTGINFMSRAFADQFVKELIDLESTTKVKVSMGNLSFPIQQMLSTVRITQSERKVLESTIRTMRFDSVDAMKDFMFAW